MNVEVFAAVRTFEQTGEDTAFRLLTMRRFFDISFDTTTFVKGILIFPKLVEQAGILC